MHFQRRGAEKMESCAEECFPILLCKPLFFLCASALKIRLPVHPLRECTESPVIGVAQSREDAKQQYFHGFLCAFAPLREASLNSGTPSQRLRTRRVLPAEGDGAPLLPAFQSALRWWFLTKHEDFSKYFLRSSPGRIWVKVRFGGVLLQHPAIIV